MSTWNHEHRVSGAFGLSLPGLGRLMRFVALLTPAVSKPCSFAESSNEGTHPHHFLLVGGMGAVVEAPWIVRRYAVEVRQREDDRAYRAQLRLHSNRDCEVRQRWRRGVSRP
jgi:hypothetical protein